MAARPAAARQGLSPTGRGRRCELAPLPVRAAVAPPRRGWRRRTMRTPRRKRWGPELAELFTAYLRACKQDERALSTLPPGRFLMPGDLEGSPALTFAPMDGPAPGRARPGSLHAMMARRYEAYKTRRAAVLPRARRAARPADVLVDAFRRSCPGRSPRRLEPGQTEILGCFRPGRGNFLSASGAAHRPDPGRCHQGRPSASREP